MIDEIRQSLHYGTYIEHSKSIKLAADENNKLFYTIANKMKSDEDRIKGLGLLRSTLMLYAISIELMLKAVALYKERENIKSGEIKTFKDFLNKWTSNKMGKSHNFIQLINYYDLKIPENDLELIHSLQNYSIWAGRFPFPKNETDIKVFENSKVPIGSSVSLSYIERIEKIINDQIRNINE